MSFKFSTLALPLLAGFAGLAVLPGCADDAGSGSLVVPFRIGSGTTPCDDPAINVSKVRATLDDGISETADCELGEIRVNDVPAGSYDLVVEGLDANGTAIFDNLDGGPDRVEVLGEGSTVEFDEVTLTAAPAKLYLGWATGLLTCENLNVDGFEIEAWGVGGIEMLLSGSMDCTRPADDGAAGYRRLEDSNRDLTGNDVSQVLVQPVDSAGGEVGAVLIFDMEPPGHGQTIKISLDCGEDSCSCSNTNDDDECIAD